MSIHIMPEPFPDMQTTLHPIVAGKTLQRLLLCILTQLNGR